MRVHRIRAARSARAPGGARLATPLLTAALLLGVACTAGTSPGGGNPGGGNPGGGDPESPADPGCAVPSTWTPPAKATTVVGDGTAASCTAAALQAAVTAGGLVTFACGAAPATIPLTAAIKLDNGKKRTFLDGGGKITLDGGGATRILDVASWQELSLRNLTLQNAATVPTAADFDASGKTADGKFTGAAVAGGYQSKVEVIHATFQGNRAKQAAAIAIGSDADLTIVDSAFLDNSAWEDGAIKSLLSRLTIVNSRFEGNSGTLAPADIPGATNYGGTGAVSTDGASLTSYTKGGLGTGGTISICGATFKDNTSAKGGGAIFLWAYAPDRIVVKNSTFQGNQGGGLGGAGRVSLGFTDHTYSCTSPKTNCTITTPGTIEIEGSSFLSNYSQGNAGALYVDCYGACAIRNSTFHGNDAGGVGSVLQSGGYGADVGGPGPGLHLSNVTLSHNGDKHGQMNLWGSGLVIDNTVFESSNPVCQSADQTHARGGHVIQLVPAGSKAYGVTTPCVAGAKVITTDPAPLPALPADNGGPTWTVLPAAGSPLIGAGADCEPLDQRGVARDTAKCTVGAVEP